MKQKKVRRGTMHVQKIDKHDIRDIRKHTIRALHQIEGIVKILEEEKDKKSGK